MPGVPAESASVRATTPFEGQKPGTSGLRKKTREFMQPGYLSNYVQAVFDCLPESAVRGGTLLVAGDGRYFCDDAIKKIVAIAAGNGVGRVWIAKDGMATTPACSAILRLREEGAAFGGFILTASHNPGGIDADFGIKYNTANGAPALENLTDRVYERTKQIQEIKFVKLLDFDLDTLGTKVLIKEQFMPDFGGHHPDPNLEYAKELVKTMKIFDPENADEKTPLFGAAADGDCDRNMILGETN
ncbi:hypothetical protein Emed_001049 [Eimeria media]